MTKRGSAKQGDVPLFMKCLQDDDGLNSYTGYILWCHVNALRVPGVPQAGAQQVHHLYMDKPQWIELAAHLASEPLEAGEALATSATGKLDCAHHDVEIALLAFVVHLGKAIHFSKIPALQSSTCWQLHH